MEAWIEIQLGGGNLVIGVVGLIIAYVGMRVCVTNYYIMSSSDGYLRNVEYKNERQRKLYGLSPFLWMLGLIILCFGLLVAAVTILPLFPNIDCCL